jgi:hypothetical protein
MMRGGDSREGELMSNPVMVAFTGISDPAREEEFNEWYDTVHAVESLKIKGVLSCRRYKLAPRQMMPPDLPQFFAIYEIDPEVLDSLPDALAAKAAAGEISVHELMQSGTMGFYEFVSEPEL